MTERSWIKYFWKDDVLIERGEGNTPSEVAPTAAPTFDLCHGVVCAAAAEALSPPPETSP